MRGQPAATSPEIAHRAGLNERYVREWLGAMTTGGIVDFDRTSTRYRLPDEHAAFLTRAAAADNMAVFAQYIRILGSVEDDIIACFKNGGGVPYEKFPRFHEVMAEDSGQSVMSSLESHILPLVPGLSERLAAGRALARPRMRAGPDHHAAGRALPKELVHRHGPLARGHCVGAQDNTSAKELAQRRIRGARPVATSTKPRTGSFRLRHHLRCRARPGAAAARAARHPSHAQARRCVSDAGHQGIELRPQQYRPSARHHASTRSRACTA